MFSFRLSLLLAAPLALAPSLASVSWAQDPPSQPAEVGETAPRTHFAIREQVVNEGLPPPPEELDRSTPQRTWTALKRACAEGKPELALHTLNLNDVPAVDRPTMAPGLARQLCEVLSTLGRARDRKLDDTPDGPILDEKPTNREVALQVTLPTGSEELWLMRVKDTVSGKQPWLFSRRSVSLIPSWHQLLVRKESAAARMDADTLNALGPIPPDWKTNSPRKAAEHFASLIASDRYAEAARMLDLSAIPAAQQEREGPRLARRLGRLIPTLREQPLGRLSNDPRGAPEAELEIDDELVARAPEGGAESALLLGLYPRSGAKSVWLFTSETVGRIDPLYQQYGQGWFGDHLPSILFAHSLFGLQLWQWLVFLAAIAISIVLGFALALVARRLFLILASVTSWTWDDEMASVTRGPLSLLFTTFILGALSTRYLALNGASLSSLVSLLKLASILSVGWLAMRLVDVAGNAMTRAFTGRNDHLATAMVPVVRRVLKPIIGVIVGVIALQNLGVNVGGLLAGLGIGGIAVALAGKSTLENLIGSIAIAFDRPFRIGDFVKVGDIMGTVEELGLRSTRIRTLDRTIVTIPNGELAISKVENFGMRDRMRLFTTLNLGLESSTDQIRFAIDEIKRYLLTHPKVWQDSFVVRFIGHSNATFQPALQIELMLWVTVTDFAIFTGYREEILLRVGELLERAGLKLARPTRTMEEPPEGGSEAERALRETAAAEVAKRRAEGSLCLPEIPPKVRGTPNPS